jgi:hypothetical protein
MSSFEYAMVLISSNSCLATRERRLAPCGKLARWSPADA